MAVGVSVGGEVNCLAKMHVGNTDCMKSLEIMVSCLPSWGAFQSMDEGFPLQASGVTALWFTHIIHSAALCSNSLFSNVDFWLNEWISCACQWCPDQWCNKFTFCIFWFSYCYHLSINIKCLLFLFFKYSHMKIFIFHNQFGSSSWIALSLLIWTGLILCSSVISVFFLFFPKHTAVTLFLLSLPTKVTKKGQSG